MAEFALVNVNPVFFNISDDVVPASASFPKLSFNSKSSTISIEDPFKGKSPSTVP